MERSNSGVRRLRRAVAAGLVVATCLLAPASSAAREKWVSLRSKNFTVVGNAGEGDQRKMAVRLEQFRHLISLLFPNTRIETPVPTTVVLFKNHDSFKPFKPHYKGKVRENVGGYFLASSDVNYIALTEELGGVTPYEVIYHEYQHFVLRNNLPNAPLWLNEGLAEFYSTFNATGERTADLGNPIAHHVHTLRDRQMLPLETLLTVDHRSPHYNETSKAGIFYAQSWALIHYLMLGEGGKRQGQLTQFIGRLNSEMTLEENFRQSFQADYKTVGDELRAYVRRFTFPALKVTFHKEVDFSKEVTSSPMSEAEVEYLSGDLLLRGGRFEEAEKYLRRALELNPSHARAHVSMTLLRMRLADLSEARKHAQTAVEADASDYLGHYYLGQVLSRQREHEEAVKSYLLAIKLRPDIAALHFDLGYAYLNAGREQEAVDAFRQSTRLDPRNPFPYRSRSYVYLRLARGGFAASDAETYIKRQGWRDEHAPYMALAAHFGHRQVRQDAKASKILEEAAAKLDATAWPYPVFKYLRRELTAEKLLAEAGNDNDKLTEAHAYVGLDLSLGGQRDAALPHLRWVAENGNRNFVEYPLAVAEIERIEKAARAQGN
ncbi:MAG TPA: tetratricopeptide repeat protein [Pyrinomonadaceae bacterium]|nr:tetratricopeptide repeat protein [Pyrinomonadaceae bacterium]